MRYISSRGGAPPVDFRAATLGGTAPDGGLYLPEQWPAFTAGELRGWRGLSYAELAARVLAPFTAGVIARDELAELTVRAAAAFDHRAVAPLRQLDGQQWLAELFHGPTLAFKDIALQLLGQLFARFLAEPGARPLTLIGATSGDTGSAAIAAVAGAPRAEIFMLHPLDRVSEVQRRQMTTVAGANVHAIAIEGSFDDCQALVKALFADPALARLRLGAVNSINWARIAAQAVIYFAAALALGGPDRRVAFAVPTGNFGNAFAGWAAARMGLPVERLIVATNTNDIVHRALAQGDYRVGDVTATPAPAMDIQVASNFERLLFELGGRDGAMLAGRMAGFDRDRALRLAPGERQAAAGLFASTSISTEDMRATMRLAFERYGLLLDPHSAIGLAAAQRAKLDRDVAVVTLATAHPAKFPDAVEEAAGERPAVPPRLAALADLPERSLRLPNSLAAVREHILSRSAFAHG